MKILVEDSPCWNDQETIEQIALFTGRVVDVHSHNPLILILENGRKRDAKTLKKKKFKVVVIEETTQTKKPQMVR